MPVSATRPEPRDLVDLDRYPIEDLGAPAGAALVAAQRDRFGALGLVSLPGFVRAAVLPAMVDEATGLAAGCHHQDVEGTPYLARPDRSLGADHPRAHVGRSALTAVPYDRFPPDSTLRALYEWDPLMEFVAAVLDHPTLHRYADPLGALNVAVMDEGDELAWHFDQTDFVVSIALRSSAGGGEFLNARNLRTADDEHYDDVAAVLSGKAPDRVTTVAMTAGTLMLFAGRNSLHAVSPVRGPVPRSVALLAYDTRPDTDSTDALKLVRYGRSA